MRLSNLGLQLSAVRGGIGISVSIGSGFAITAVQLTATVNGLEGGETVTYQWQADGVDIGAATASTFTPTIGTNVADADSITCIATVDGTPYTSNARIAAYAAGSVTESALANWTIDDDALNVSFVSDFTTTNLTGSYVISGLPGGVVDDGDGTISGTVDGTTETPATEGFTVTFTDQYGRTIVGSYSVDTVYRTQAIGGTDLDLSLQISTTITATDLTANWTLNGNTLTWAITGTALPSGLSVDSAGELTGTTTASASADATYTLRGTDEYGRTTDDTFTLEVISDPFAGYAANGSTPEMGADFVTETYWASGTATTFDALITYTGASASTKIDSGGNLVTVTSGTPRRAAYYYNGTSYVNGGIQIESAAATNLVTYSNDFTDASWTNQGSTEATSAVNGPDGNLATTLTATAANSRHLIQRGPITITAGAATTSFYLKYNNNQWVAVATYEFQYLGANFDLLNGVKGATSTGVTSEMEDVGGGWYRCSITYTHAGTSGYAVVLLMDSDRTTYITSWIAAGTEKVEIYGAQFEQGSVATSYIPTNGSTATRAAQTATIAAANLPYSATAMSIQQSGLMTYADNDLGEEATFFDWFKSSGEFIDLRLVTSSTRTGEPQAYQRDSLQDIVVLGSTQYSPGVNVAYNLATRNGATFIQGAKDGVSGGEDATPVSLPDLSATDFEIGKLGNFIIAQQLIWPTDIADAGIDEAST